MEPERRIEKWLRAFAKKRREQAGSPMELRPAMRERLQREVARQAEQKSRGFFSQLLLGLQPRLAFAVCFTALAIGAWVLWPQFSSPPAATLSMNNTSVLKPQPNQPAPELAPPPVASAPVFKEEISRQADRPVPATPPTTQPVIVSADRDLTVAPNDVPKDRNRAPDSLGQKQAPVKSFASPAPATNLYLAKKESAVESLASANTSLKGATGSLPPVQFQQDSNRVIASYALTADQQSSGAIQASPQSTAAAARVEFFSQAKATIDGTSTLAASQVFSRLGSLTTRRNANTAEPPAPVLLSFRVEQNGNDMKVIDADGSVYTGAVQIAQQEPGGVGIASAAPRNTPGSRLLRVSAPAPQTYFFRVAGTNRNLNQNVVFSGNFVPLTNSQLTTGVQGFGGGGGSGGRASGQAVETVLSHSSIKGSMVIGDQKAVDVVATPTQ